MESLIGYVSDEEADDRFGGQRYFGGRAGTVRRDDDTNYDDVTMDMSEDSNNNESDRELPPAEPEPPAPRQRTSPAAATADRTPPRSADKDRSPRRERDRRRDSRERSRRRDSPEHARRDGWDSPDRARRDGRDSEERARRDGRSPPERTRRDGRDTPERTRRDGRNSPERTRRDGRNSPERTRREKRDRDRHDRDLSPRRDDRRGSGSERGRRGDQSVGRRGLLGEHPDERASDAHKVPALMDLKPFGGEAPPTALARDSKDVRGGDRERRDRERDKDRDAHRDKSKEREGHREKEKDREGHREKDKEKEGHREKDKDRHGRRSQEKKSKKRSRSRSRERRTSRERGGRGERERARADHAAHPAAPPPPLRAPLDLHPPYAPRGGAVPEPRSVALGAPTAGPEYRPSYKVSKKLQVMEKMGLQIKTPDGSMATAQQLMQRTVAEQQGTATGTLARLPSYYNPNAVNATKIVTQVEKRKLLWGSKKEEEAAQSVPAAAVKWTGTKFAQDTDGKVASKFMRLMGIKDPAAVQPAAVAEVDSESDLNKKQEEMFQAMQAQYDVARVTTHTMRGVGLGFQRHY